MMNLFNVLSDLCVCVAIFQLKLSSTKYLITRAKRFLIFNPGLLFLKQQQSVRFIANRFTTVRNYSFQSQLHGLQEESFATIYSTYLQLYRLTMKIFISLDSSLGFCLMLWILFPILLGFSLFLYPSNVVNVVLLFTRFGE